MTPRVLAIALVAGLVAGPSLAQGWTVRPLPRPEPAAVRVPLEEFRPMPRPDGIAGQAVRFDCVPAESVADADIRRYAATFAENPKLCIETEAFTENGLNWQLHVITNRGKRRGPTLILLHDHENASFDTAIHGVLRYGGRIVAVEANEARNLGGVQDPNRNFGTTAAATATCREMARKPAPRFTKAIQGYFSRRHPVITLHNNDDGYSGGGGRGTISAKRQSAILTGLMTPKPGPGRLSDEDNAVLLASPRSLAESNGMQRAITYFHARGINVIFEHVTPERNDCSLSNYVVLNRLGDYYNLEAEHGDVASQVVMLDTLMAYLKIR